MLLPCAVWLQPGDCPVDSARLCILYSAIFHIWRPFHPNTKVVRIGSLKIVQFVKFWLIVNVASRYCKNRAVRWILKSHRKTNTCTYFRLVLSHAVHYRHVSIAVAFIIRVIYTITVSPNKPLKCVSETLSVSKLTRKYIHFTGSCNRPSSCVRSLRYSL